MHLLKDYKSSYFCGRNIFVDDNGFPPYFHVTSIRPGWSARPYKTIPMKHCTYETPVGRKPLRGIINMGPRKIMWGLPSKVASCKYGPNRQFISANKKYLVIYRIIIRDN